MYENGGIDMDVREKSEQSQTIRKGERERRMPTADKRTINVCSLLIK